MGPKLLIVGEETPFSAAIEKVHAQNQRVFAVKGQEELYLVEAGTLINQALERAKAESHSPLGSVKRQIEILKKLCISTDPVLTALRSSQLWPIRHRIVDSVVKPVSFYADSEGGPDVKENIQQAFSLIYVCESGLHTWPGVSSPPSQCPNGKPYQLQSI
jgi:hypothetical protein